MDPLRLHSHGNTHYRLPSARAQACQFPLEISGHLRNIAQRHRTAHTFARLEDPRTRTSVLQKTKRLLDGGIDLKATRCIWHSTLVPVYALRIALLIRFNRLKTTKQAQTYYGTQLVESTTCPHCGDGTDDADHLLYKCNSAETSHLIKLRHDHAVQILRAAIQRNLRGAHYLHSDARNTATLTNKTSTLPDAGTSRKFPAAVLPLDLQTSYPDILLIDLPHTDVLALHHQRKSIPRVTRRNCTIAIIEIKYAFDLLIHDRTQEAIDQHAQLQAHLLAAGWGTVDIHPFIIGSAGTFYILGKVLRFSVSLTA